MIRYRSALLSLILIPAMLLASCGKSTEPKESESDSTTNKTYTTEKEENNMPNTTTERYGEDYSLIIDPAKRAGKISNLLYGACMEDVNHELYGGIWSQMIFGESFEEAAAHSENSGFKSAGGAWYVEEDQGGDQLCIDKTANGPKLLISDTDCTEGYIEADVWVDGEASGFLIKTSNATEGADNFDGYEISILNGGVRLGKHVHNYTNISDTPCNAPQKTWIHLRAEFTGNTMTVYIDGTQVVSYTDPSPIQKGSVGFRAWNANTKWKNVRVSIGGEEKEISFDSFKQGSSTAGMWESAISDGTVGQTSVITSGVYNGKQAQRLEITSGTGSLSINNMGLNRSGMGFVADKDYNGYIYARSDAPVIVYTALESADGSKRYAEASFTVSGDYKKYEFFLTPDTTDSAGRFVIEIRQAGCLDVDYAFLEPGSWGLYKGLHVRKDVAEMLEKQGITVLRFGGCMANAADYKWKKMTGNPEDRGVYNGWWYAYSSYGFGIIEFMDLCEALGVAYVPDFSSYESAEDMADFIRFAYGTDQNDPWVKLRREMGREEPYNLQYIQIGNEDKVDQAFAGRFNAIANAVWALNPDVTLIVGDFEYKEVITNPNRFTGNSSGITSLAGHKLILDNAAEKGGRVWFDIHFWSESGADPEQFFKPALSFYEALKTISPEADTGLCVLELNANAHHFERALCNALAIKFAEELDGVIKIMCSANALQVQDQNDNGWNQGLIFMDSDSAWYQPPAYIDRMLLDAHLPYALTIEEDVRTNKFDITAAVSEDGKCVTVKILNRTGSKKGVGIEIPAFTDGKVTMTSVEYADRLTAVNTNAKPENTKPADPVVTEDALRDGWVLVNAQGYSLTVVTFTIS